jgi:hypothetical protein
LGRRTEVQQQHLQRHGQQRLLLAQLEQSGLAGVEIEDAISSAS